MFVKKKNSSFYWLHTKYFYSLLIRSLLRQISESCHSQLATTFLMVRFCVLLWLSLRLVYTCDFCCALQCNFCRKRRFQFSFSASRVQYFLAFLPNIATKLHQVSSMFKTSAISRRQIAQKSSLDYTCDIYRKLKRDKNCTKNCMCKQTFKELNG